MYLTIPPKHKHNNYWSTHESVWLPFTQAHFIVNNHNNSEKCLLKVDLRRK